MRFLILLGVLLVPLAYLDGAGLLPVIQAVLPVVGLLGLLVALLSVLTRDAPGTVVAVAASLALLVPVLPWAPRAAVPAAQAHGEDLRVVTINTEFGGADPDGIVAAVREHDADVLVLLEETPQHWRALGAAGLRGLLPHATGTVSDSAAGTVVATRDPATCLDTTIACGRVVPAVRSADEPFTQVSLRLAGGTVLRGAHPFPPVGARAATWHTSLQSLQRWVHDAHGHEPRLVVTGDLNAGPGHPAFRAIADGLDQGPRAWPWQPTWPLGSLVPPFVQIDHVLTRGFAVVDEATLRVPGTDHAGVRAHLRPTR
ncbi:endonuclease/exonuclease/phosphatase family protein [Mobilicoccus caccae]|uniref:Endonuclease/exonuclease/phosphatase domain-containing protein n=1 Tax=Mobilicoccus caccae TaxID=1859295 RepID=A0ABQ6IN79_9MICO|nr:endonuclease/exonuclease/phosphatase family protein [Mobilicoccus caccae]GMA39365.1 hypothetical protein GCM10025883_14100 [Mobilicoccus caccae]